MTAAASIDAPMGIRPGVMGDASELVPAGGSLDELADAAASCAACPLYRDAERTVFGRGRPRAPIVLVGEQPGDQEDHRGEPFVGPAGRVLWACVEDAGLDRTQLYVTNAVKHFKHERRGARRIHKRPDAGEITACHPWLEAELAAVRPRVVVALGAVAARSLVGRNVPIAASRGTPLDVGGRPLVVTYHPSAVLRADERAAEVRQALVDDLATAGHLAAED
jgi:DNA polymerase